jgi:photosystem II stability/assembly factor-like uncharacterized protein
MRRISASSTRRVAYSASRKVPGIWRLSRSINLVLVWLALYVLTMQTIHAQGFNQIYPSFPANEVTDMLRWNADTLFAAGCNWSLLRSTDAGASWDEMLGGWPRYNLVRMGSDGRHLFLLPVGTGFTVAAMREETGLRLLRYDPRTLRMDTLWVERVAGDPRFLYVDLAAGESVVTILQIGDTTKLLRSTDGGSSWSHCRLPDGYDAAINGWNTQLSVRDAMHMLFFVNVAPDVAAGRHVFRTEDGGQTWSEVPGVVQDYLRSARTPRFPAGWFGDSVVVVVSGRSTPVISTNLGMSWKEAAPIQGMITAIGIHEGVAGFAVDQQGQVWRTRDGGDSWVKVREGVVPPPSGEISGCAVQLGPDTLVTIDMVGQIQRTTNGGLTWDAVRHVALGEFYDPQFVTSDIGFIKASDRTTGAVCFLRTTDGGSTWKEHGDVLRHGQAVKFFHTDSRHGFALRNHNATQSEDTLIYRSADGGDHWEPVFRWSEQAGIDINILPRGRWFRNADTGIVPLKGNRLLRTTDGGGNWEVYPGPSVVIGEETDMRIQWLDTRGAHSMWIAAERAVLRSNDAGLSWTLALELPDSLPRSRGFARVTILGDESVAVVSGNTTTAHVMYLTTDNGATWDSWPAVAGADGELFPGLRGTGISGSASFGYTSNRDVYRTEDGWRTHALHWTHSHVALNDFRQMFFLDQQYGWISGANGIFRTTNGGVNWTEVTPARQPSLRIAAIWPQPLSGSGILNARIESDRPGHARLELFDLLGRSRAIPFDGTLEGSREVHWSTANLETGCYLLRLIAGQKVSMRLVVKR